MTLTFLKIHRLGQLHDEIVAAYPDLRETLTVEGSVGGVPEAIRLTLRDGIADPGLAAIVAAHVPDFTPKPPNPAVTRLKAWVRDPTNPPPSREVVLDLIRLLARSLTD